VLHFTLNTEKSYLDVKSLYMELVHFSSPVGVANRDPSALTPVQPG